MFDLCKVKLYCCSVFVVVFFHYLVNVSLQNSLHFALTRNKEKKNSELTAHCPV